MSNNTIDLFGDPRQHHRKHDMKTSMDHAESLVMDRGQTIREAILMQLHLVGCTGATGRELVDALPPAWNNSIWTMLRRLRREGLSVWLPLHRGHGQVQMHSEYVAPWLQMNPEQRQAFMRLNQANHTKPGDQITCPHCKTHISISHAREQERLGR